jgi:protocatechuate 3,4-dioxygenase, alpha subunit
MDLTPTPSQTVGPFFQVGLAAEKRCVRCLAGPRTKGERIWLTLRVLDGEGVPVNDAMIEVWQANADGKYNHPDDPQAKPIDGEFSGFGRLGTGEDGICEFETIKPGRVLDAGHALQAPHLNLAVFARGMPKHLFTRVYFSGDPANSEDPVLALVPSARRTTLFAQPATTPANHWQMELHLQGPQETVFFDL